MVQPDIQRIFDDPASWIHRDWSGAATSKLKGISKGVLNTFLYRLYEFEDGVPNTFIERQVLLNWNELDRIALLMACQRHKATLFQRRDIKLSASLKQFMSMDIMTSTVDPAVFNVSDLELLGGREMLILSKAVPPYLANRIVLRTPKRAQLQQATQQFNLSLFQIAAQYAKNNDRI